MKNKKFFRIILSILLAVVIFLGVVLITKRDKEAYIIFIPLLMMFISLIINFFINYDLLKPKGEKRKAAIIGNIVIFIVTVLGVLLINHMLIDVLTYENGHKIVIFGLKVSDLVADSFFRTTSFSFYLFALSVFYLFLAPITNKKG